MRAELISSVVEHRPLVVALGTFDNFLLNSENSTKTLEGVRGLQAANIRIRCVIVIFIPWWS